MERGGEIGEGIVDFILDKKRLVGLSNVETRFPDLLLI